MAQVKERGGGGEERKETLADKHLDFENVRSPANAALDWLDMCRSKVDQRWITTHFEAVFFIVSSILSLRFFQKLDSVIAKNRSSQCRTHAFAAQPTPS